MAEYNNLKDVFFGSKFHVGRGMATYDKSLNSVLFNTLPDINTVANNEDAINAIAESEKSVIAIAGSSVAVDVLGRNETVWDAIMSSEMAKEAAKKSGVAVDLSGTPGEAFLRAGSFQEGYFGIVPASEFITGVELASLVGVSAGTSQFSVEGWLKFIYGGNIQFVAKKPIRHSISWDHINAANCVFGTKTVQIGGLLYKVRLMRAGKVDPMSSSSGSANHGSEWNKLMLPIHIEAKEKNWAYLSNVETDIPYWGIDFTDGDLHTHNSFGNGSYSWCQETVSASRVLRGFSGVSSSGHHSPSTATTNYGWRPVLELVA